MLRHCLLAAAVIGVAMRGRARAVGIGVGIGAGGRRRAAAAGEDEKEQGKKRYTSHTSNMVLTSGRFAPLVVNFT